MEDDADDRPPTHLEAIRAAWYELKEGVSFRAFCLTNPDPFEEGGDFPPRDWEPMSVAEMVGAGMGMSREEVAEIVARPHAATA